MASFDVSNETDTLHVEFPGNDLVEEFDLRDHWATVTDGSVLLVFKKLPTVRVRGEGDMRGRVLVAAYGVGLWRAKGIMKEKGRDHG